jgi:hypothetical protein
MNAYTNAFLYLVSAYALTIAGYTGTSAPRVQSVDATADDDACVDFSTAQAAPAWLVRAAAEIAITSPLDDIDY